MRQNDNSKIMYVIYEMSHSCEYYGHTYFNSYRAAHIAFAKYLFDDMCTYLQAQKNSIVCYVYVSTSQHSGIFCCILVHVSAKKTDRYLSLRARICKHNITVSCVMCTCLQVQWK
jgi:hypothetical protein